ncbi:MAG: DUF5057 domain-containing protein [Clostridiales bacterium]|nr:DUF5057 domain-containing protein [Clostridiales bacterium]
MKKLKNVLAMLLCFAMVLSLLFFAPDLTQKAEAATSLPWIEEIKRSTGSFDILEIVPQAGSGSIGWYIDGQEPGANWAKDSLAALPTKAQRVSAAAVYLSALQSAGLLGAADATPLRKTGDYAEYAPWERGSTADLKTLALAAQETYTGVTGTFTENPTGGEYRADNSYALSAGGAGGNYDQDVSALSAVTAAPTDGLTHYFITLGAFSALPALNNPADGLLIYQEAEYIDADNNGVMDAPYEIAIYEANLVNAAYIAEHPTEVTYLNFHGLMGSTYMTGFNILAQYYTVPFTVSTDFSAAAPQFEAAADAFVRVDNGLGHFDAVTASYTYVGTGAAGANYSYSAADSGSSYTVMTKTVFYTGGFTNNNWFLRYVFDWESGEPSPVIKVRSLTSGNVTADLVSGADLIVLSEGQGTITTPYAAGNDITTAVGDAIREADESKLPLIVANSLRSQTGLAIGSLAAELCSGGASHYASENVYCHEAPLAASAFPSAISGDHTQSTDPFYPVWYELDYENFLRLQNDPGAVTLSETVTMAACVRYIINYGGQRVITNKTAIRVLELQPGRGSHLTAAMVSGWTGIATNNIAIDTMSSAEFIGKIDDLTETYDLVYVGADLTGFKTTGSGSSFKTDYNDSAMDGLIYCNIGDTWLTGTDYKLSGLLDRDYADSIFSQSGTSYNKVNANDLARTFRFSGNDLTAAKVSELVDFAAAGYPVVVADKLMSGTTAVDAYTFRAVLTENSGVLSCDALAVAGAIPAGVTKTYQWYKDGSPVGTGGNTYTPLTAADAGTYSCSITISGQTATSNTAYVTVTDVPYGVDEDSSTAQQGSYPSGSTKYSITITRTPQQGSDKYSISVNPTSGVSDYQWYVYSGYDWRKVQGAKASTYTPDYDNSYYYCEVTINGSPYDSQYASTNGYENGKQTAQYNITNHTTFNINISYRITTGGVVLTAVGNPPITFPGDWDIRWYRNNTRIYDFDEDYVVTVQQAGSYRCMLRWEDNTEDPAYSSTFIIAVGQKDVDITLHSGGTTATVPAVPATLDVSTATVDQCSQVYSFLDTVTGRANVFTESGALGSKNTIVQYLNLSKPKIVLTESPVAYTGPGGASLAGKTVRYTFTIENETDVTPADTRYDCNLYFDMNADGRYKFPEEQLADIAITDSGGSVVRTGELKAGVAYTVTRTLPDEYVGIVPWQLEVVKVGQARVHASAHGYTHVAGVKTNINILQILNGNTIGSSLNLITNSTYLSNFDDATDFNLVISTVTMSTLNANGPYTVTTKNVSTTGATTTNEEFSSRSALFEHYDMLILGFSDCYGNLNKDAANAVVGFIDSGKSVLFTHDTTSRCNLPVNQYATTAGTTVDHDSYYWGYYFNTILRSAVGLDRYGVTDSDYGVTRFSPLWVENDEQKINVAAGALSYSSWYDDAQTVTYAAEMTGAGYSVAYKPVSGGTAKVTVPEVQGVSRLELVTQNRANYKASFQDADSGYNTVQNGNYLTKSVSQVNEGQITTYPFNLNLKGFAAPDDTSAPLRNSSTMTIVDTHNQYYQLNMNSDDIVVWYCLADGTYSSDNVYGYIPNDAMNNYYIYSVGNITYSGAGHSGDNASADEAKLFINTMIAAYRTTAEPPEVTFVDPADPNKVIADVFYVSDNNDEGSVLASDLDKLPDDAAVYFKVTDPSLGVKTTTAAFSFNSGGTVVQRVLPIYVKNGSLSPINVDAGSPKPYSLSSGVIYYFYPSAEILDILARDGSVKLTVSVTSSLLMGQPDTAEVTLRKIGLFLLD